MSMKELTFIGEYTRHCPVCHCDEEMAEYKCSYQGEEYTERTCKGCGKTFKVYGVAK